MEGIGNSGGGCSCWGPFVFFFRMGLLEDEVVGCWLLGREGVWWR